MIGDFFNTLMSSQWLNDFVYLIMQVIMGLVGILLLPISLVIQVLVPDFNIALERIPDMFAYALTYMGWIINAFAIPSIVISLTVAMYTFYVLARLSFWGFKLALSWYKAIK